MFTKKEFKKLLNDRVLILDGAMGTEIQKHSLTEKDFRGSQFEDWPSELKGNNDLLTLTKPQLIKEIHKNFVDAGSDIIETNTFNSNSTSQSDYGLEAIVYDLNYQGSVLAKKIAKIVGKDITFEIEKDENINQKLIQLGYHVIRFWETDIKATPEKCLQKILKAIKKSLK